jgi:hypothetical protein
VSSEFIRQPAFRGLIIFTGNSAVFPEYRFRNMAIIARFFRSYAGVLVVSALPSEEAGGNNQNHINVIINETFATI